MGFYIRKSFTFGPLRLNLSKHGFGVSVGVRGARAGLTSDGRPYVHAGRRGLYWRAYLGRSGRGRPDYAAGPLVHWEETGVTYPAAEPPAPAATIEEGLLPPPCRVWPPAVALAAAVGLAAAVAGPWRLLPLAAAAGATWIVARKLRRRAARRRAERTVADWIAAGGVVDDAARRTLSEALGHPGLGVEDRVFLAKWTLWRFLERQVRTAEPEALGAAARELEAWLGVDPGFARRARLDAYRSLVAEALADRELTVEEEAALEAVRRALGIPEDAVAQERRWVARFAELRELRRGRLPVLEARSELARGERLHFEAPARLLRERTLRRFKREGRTHTVRGLTLESEGLLRVTDRRIEFAGDRRLSIPLERLAAVEVDADRNLLVLDRTDRSRPVLLTTPDALRAGAIAAAAAGL